MLKSKDSSQSGDIPGKIDLAMLKSRKSALVDYLQENIKVDVTFDEVRLGLSKIKEPLSKAVLEDRA